MALALAAAIPAWAQSGRTSASFLVQVAPLLASPQRATCVRDAYPGAFGAQVMVVCSTGAVVGVVQPPVTPGPTHGGAQRHLLQVTRGEQYVGTIEAQTAAGTVLGWQVIQSPGQEYVELTLGW